MAIVGLGTDLVAVARIDRVLAHRPQRFIERILTAKEQRQLAQRQRKSTFLASRFAAKEAASKALGTGIAGGIRFTDFEVSNLPSGQPTMTLSGVAAERATQLGVSHIWLSLTDEKAHAMATVILEHHV